MEFWNNLNSRERTVIGFSIPLVFLVAVYFYYWEPMSEKLDRLRIEVPEKAAELAWAEYEIGISSEWLKKSVSNGSRTPILTVIEAHAIKFDVKNAIQRVQPDELQVKLWFQEVVADQWFKFINRLVADGISVDSATLSRTKNGKMNVRVTLSQ